MARATFLPNLCWNCDSNSKSVSENHLTRKDDQYLLCEKQCRELCKYLNVVTLNMPRYEKHILSAKMRDCGYTMLELAPS